MNKEDRDEICNVISEMLDNPDKHGIYPTSTAYLRLEQYILLARIEAIGWAYADACVCLDKGGDPRTQYMAEVLKRAMVSA